MSFKLNLLQKKVLKIFIQLRWIQLNRLANELGLVRFVILLALLTGLVLYIFASSTESKGAMVLTIIALTGIFLLHQIRTDKTFVKRHMSCQKCIFVTEYLALLAPVWTGLIVHQHYVHFLVILVATPLIASIQIHSAKQKVLHTKLQQWIPDEAFEWKSGIRKVFFILIPLWIIGLLASPLTPVLPVIVLLLIGIISMGFYDKNEPSVMVQTYELSPQRFILRKLQVQLLLLTVVLLPLMIAFIIFHPSYWFLMPIFYLLVTNLQVYSILTKYSFYQPNAISAAANFFQSIGAIALLIPLFIPLIWLLCIRFYINSIARLTPYLNDNN